MLSWGCDIRRRHVGCAEHVIGQLHLALKKLSSVVINGLICQNIALIIEKNKSDYYQCYSPARQTSWTKLISSSDQLRYVFVYLGIGLNRPILL